MTQYLLPVVLVDELLDPQGEGFGREPEERDELRLFLVGGDEDLREPLFLVPGGFWSSSFLRLEK